MKATLDHTDVKRSEGKRGAIDVVSFLLSCFSFLLYLLLTRRSRNWVLTHEAQLIWTIVQVTWEKLRCTASRLGHQTPHHQAAMCLQILNIYKNY